MSSEIYSQNPVVTAVITGTAPGPARMAAARGILPLPQQDLLEILVNLAGGSDVELAATAKTTIAAQEESSLQNLFESDQVAPTVLGYFAESGEISSDLRHTLIRNDLTPDRAIVSFARNTTDGELLEIIAVNQQRLIRTPAIIDAIINNAFRTAEAERRASEVKREFFQKERGAQQIANELRAQGKEAAAEFIEQAESADRLDADDAAFLAEHIEIPDTDIDDSWLSLEYIEEFYEETPEQREEIVNKILGEFRSEDSDISTERVSIISRIMRMTMKDRVKMAMKGDREVRNILVRDPNRVVATAVIQNPRITENEVEKISAMRTVPGDVLRQIAINRQWARNYNVIHNLAKNPRTPIAVVVGILVRLQTRDLKAIVGNRNVSEAVRKQSERLAATRRGV